MGILPARTAKHASGAQLRKLYQDGKPTKQMILHKVRALNATVWKTDDDGNRYRTRWIRSVKA